MDILGSLVIWFSWKSRSWMVLFYSLLDQCVGDLDRANRFSTFRFDEVRFIDFSAKILIDGFNRLGTVVFDFWKSKIRWFGCSLRPGTPLNSLCQEVGFICPFRGHQPYQFRSDNGSCSRTNAWQIWIAVFYPSKLVVCVIVVVISLSCPKQNLQVLPDNSPQEYIREPQAHCPLAQLGKNWNFHWAY